MDIRVGALPERPRVIERMLRTTDLVNRIMLLSDVVAPAEVDRSVMIRWFRS